MANILIYDKTTGDVLNYVRSAHTPDFVDRSDILINPDIGQLPLKYMKVVNGALVEKTGTEKAAVDEALTPKPVSTPAENILAEISQNPDLLQQLKDLLK